MSKEYITNANRSHTDVEHLNAQDKGHLDYLEGYTGLNQTGRVRLHDTKRQGSVVQMWLGQYLTFKMQAVVLSALRGCDGKPKEDPSKPITRAFRGSILLPATQEGFRDGTFMSQIPEQRFIDKFLSDLDHYPVHWLTHFMHACEIVGYFHPQPSLRDFWLHLYMRICNALHVPHESLGDVCERLSDDPYDS